MKLVINLLLLFIKLYKIKIFIIKSTTYIKLSTKPIFFVYEFVLLLF